MFSRIMVPLERSPYDEAILAYVRRLAKQAGAGLVLVHVVETPRASSPRALEARGPDTTGEAGAYLERIAAALRQEGFTVTAVLAAGEPARELAAAAAREHCDLVAMATHGHEGVEHVLRGSVANALRLRTDVPVLMLRVKR
jgi:nucleotide-binding universal stress UspA family protein